MLVCNICKKHSSVAVKYSRNGHVPIAEGSGIRCESKERLVMVVDHLQSEVHKHTTEHDCLEAAWDAGSKSHPWLNALTKT